MLYVKTQNKIYYISFTIYIATLISVMIGMPKICNKYTNPSNQVIKKLQIRYDIENQFKKNKSNNKNKSKTNYEDINSDSDNESKNQEQDSPVIAITSLNSLKQLKEDVNKISTKLKFIQHNTFLSEKNVLPFLSLDYFYIDLQKYIEVIGVPKHIKEEDTQHYVYVNIIYSMIAKRILSIKNQLEKINLDNIDTSTNQQKTILNVNEAMQKLNGCIERIQIFLNSNHIESYNEDEYNTTSVNYTTIFKGTRKAIESPKTTTLLKLSDTRNLIYDCVVIYLIQMQIMILL